MCERHGKDFSQKKKKKSQDAFITQRSIKPVALLKDMGGYEAQKAWLKTTLTMAGKGHTAE